MNKVEFIAEYGVAAYSRAMSLARVLKKDFKVELFMLDRKIIKKLVFQKKNLTKKKL